MPTPAFQNYVLQQLPRGGTDAITGSTYQPAPQLVPFYQKLFSLYRNTAGAPLAVLGCPFNSDGGAAAGNPPNGNGCANRQSISHSSDDSEQVQTARIDYNVNERNTAWFRFQADTGLQAAYTDPINPLFNAISPQPLYSFATGYTHVFSQNLVNYFNPAFSWYESLFGPANLRRRWPHCRSCCKAAVRSRPSAGSTTRGCKDRRAVAALHQRQSGLDHRRARAEVRDQHPNFPAQRLRFRRRSGANGDLRDSAAVHLWRRVDRVGDISAGEFAAVQFPQPGRLCAGHLEGHQDVDVDVRYPRDAQFESGESARCGGAAAGIVGRDIA